MIDDPGPLPRELTYVPVVHGPAAGVLARVPLQPDGRPVAEVPIGGVVYVVQRGRDGWEYVEADGLPAWQPS